MANNEPNSVSDNENIIEQHDIHQDETNYKVYRAPSDIDSQISLPRSYTLPREFKYYRRNRVRKNTRNDHFIASTNSSDGKFLLFYFFKFNYRILIIFIFLEYSKNLHKK